MCCFTPPVLGSCIWASRLADGGLEFEICSILKLLRFTMPCFRTVGLQAGGALGFGFRSRLSSNPTKMKAPDANIWSLYGCFPYSSTAHGVLDASDPNNAATPADVLNAFF